MVTENTSVGGMLGLAPGLVVQELGWDSDVDESFRNDVMDTVDGDLVEETDEAVDLVLLWWRSDDGDVVDGLFDALRDLSNGGVLWLLTPKVGRPGHVSSADLQEGAVTAGLALTTSVSVSKSWSCHKLVRPKGVVRR
ncbi:MAG TPA: DUF3052 domain-containing protein [Propionibacteriaceae bacterium]|jgi:hypothetical protein